MNILMIDDSKADQLIFSTFIKEALEVSLHFIDKQENFKSALDEHQPDIIIVDTRLQGFTGYDILEDYVESGYEAYVIMTSGAKSLIDQARATSLKVNEIVEKDSTFSALIKAVTQVVESKQ